ncbi:hypothetical protein GCM10011510_12810 [Streptococcus himalayensis]|uniref:HTH cro/C1-type domain-containing protein n=2 Tax=Streptococcus himalayensis TaxID=1888195 RepID=A0A917A8J7_9STRE|nr:hypothetical protein GCM10011510_12810 [Streptococcus himalayensis]
MSQQHLSESADVGTDYISTLETKGSNIKIDTLEKIIIGLEASPAEFFQFHTNLENPDLLEFVEEISTLDSEEQKELLHSFKTILSIIKQKKAD